MSIRVQLVTEKWSPISAAIRFQTRSWASHIELVDTEKHITIGARSFGGVKIRPCAKDHYSRIEQFTVNDYHQLPRAWDWCVTQIGKSYDYSGIAGIALNADWASDDRWFCADLIQVASIKSGLPWLSTRPSNFLGHYTPRDFLLSRELIYIP